ncbi:hypothetical protein LO762_07545 [Actinocorallia sp. API 0066]|uniref:hypothetical protein n=1 Tax=Actinocorallia sp. API 0066 TaxID=2896846 RepID=UPI001E545235|nr:hypothetical protein [Actinocorallia sp. API 0066]MCD0449043.1 hypothetical protein [Actinocorallia sp. API 0066]
MPSVTAAHKRIDGLAEPVGPRDSEEMFLAIILTTKWMITMRRRLYDCPLLHHLGPAELEEFWASC